MQEFVRGFITGGTSIYGSWGENAASWLSTRQGRCDFLLLRYEDMLADTVRELSKVASFLNVSVSAERLRQAVEHSSADRMRELEKSQAHLWSSTKDTRQDVPFVRAAKAAAWKAELSDEAIAEIESAWGTLMRYLGYEVSSRVAQTSDDPASALLLFGGK
jgi:hypothetical protein